jgi:2-keto-4-pentenoate hydratase
MTGVSGNLLRVRAVLVLALFAAASQAFDEEVAAQRAADAFLLVRPLPTLILPDAAAAVRVQDRLARRLMPALGEVIGYKAALTNPELQQRLGADRPITGLLHRAMVLPEGVPIPARAGVRLFAEADLLARVGDARINEVQDDLDLLQCVDAFALFIEVPDLLFQEGVRLDSAMLTAANAGARYGVAGPAFSVAPARGAVELLGNVQVTLQDGAGQVLAGGRGSDLLGNPVAALRWLRDALLARGTRLKPGDLLSLGSLTAPVPVKAGERLTARYAGLLKDAELSVSVTFE